MKEDDCPVHINWRHEWIPTKEELNAIEELGFYGIHDPRQICLLLGINPYHLTYATIYGEALTFHQRGQARAHLALNKSIMDLGTGQEKGDVVQFQSIRYMLQARFGYDEQRTQTCTKSQMEKRKLKFAKQIHRDNIDLATSKLIGSLSEDELKRL